MRELFPRGRYVLNNCGSTGPPLYSYFQSQQILCGFYSHWKPLFFARGWASLIRCGPPSQRIRSAICERFFITTCFMWWECEEARWNNFLAGRTQKFQLLLALWSIKGSRIFDTCCKGAARGVGTRRCSYRKQQSGTDCAAQAGHMVGCRDHGRSSGAFPHPWNMFGFRLGKPGLSSISIS